MQESSLSVQVLSSGPLCLSLCTCPPDPLSIGPPSRLHSPTCATIRFPPYSPGLYTTQQSAHSVRMSALAIGDGERPAFSSHLFTSTMSLHTSVNMQAVAAAWSSAFVRVGESKFRKSRIVTKGDTFNVGFLSETAICRSRGRNSFQPLMYEDYTFDRLWNPETW